MDHIAFPCQRAVSGWAGPLFWVVARWAPSDSEGTISFRTISADGSDGADHNSARSLASHSPGEGLSSTGSVPAI